MKDSYPSNTLLICLMGILLFLSTKDLFAQDLMPSVTVGASIYPSRDLKDTVGTYAHQRVHVGFTIPLLKNVKLNDGGLKFYRLSLGANTAMDNTQLSFLPSDRKLLAINASLNGMYKSSLKSVWLSKFTGSFFEDENTIDNPSLRLSGFAMYRRTVREAFFYTVGGIYNFSYGSGLPLPVLGVGWRFTNLASLTVILPLSVSYHFGKVGSPFVIFIRPTGGISNFYNDGRYANAAEKIVLRRKEFTGGIKKKIRLSDQWSFTSEVGLVAARRIFLSNNVKRTDGSTIFETKVQTGPYIAVGVRYKFKASEPLNDWTSEVDMIF